MKMLLITLGLSASLLCGCKTGPSPADHAFIQASVAATTAFGIQQDPGAATYLKAADGVICAAAAGTNLSYDNVVAEIESLDPALSSKTPAGVFIVNGIMAIYLGIWDSYGSNQVANSAVLQAYLTDLCVGIKAGIPVNARSRNFMRMRVQ